MRRLTISSTKRGLPSAVSRIWSFIGSGRSADARRSAISSLACARLSGRSETEVASLSPDANDGCVSANDGRAVTSNRIGPDDRVTIRSTISTTCSLAQCRSSITTATGPDAARADRIFKS